MSARRAVALLALLAAAAASLGAGLWIKDRCNFHVWDGYQYRTSCYNDIMALYAFRGLSDRRFPYVEGDGRDGADGGVEGDGDLEYPVGTGLFVGATARITSGQISFFRLNALGLALAGLIATGLLAAMTIDRRRVLLFALGPAVALYAFHNWDLLAVCLMVGALYAFRERSDTGAGGLLGIGAATKLFPGAIAPALIAVRWREGRRAPVAVIAAAAGGFALLNLPIAAWNLPGWLYPWRFQSTRFPNFETSWYMIFRHGADSASADSFWWRAYPQLTGWASAGLFLIGVAFLIRAEWRRPVMRPYALAFGAMLIFLLTAKVYSPQFALWLLPFFALVRIPWYGYAAFVVTDVAVWVAISAWFLSQPPIAAGDPGLRFLLVEIAVWVRYAALAWLLWLSRRATENVAPARPAEAAAEPVGYAT